MPESSQPRKCSIWAEDVRFLPDSDRKAGRALAARVMLRATAQAAISHALAAIVLLYLPAPIGGMRQNVSHPDSR
jgi:hypothetical protein